MNKLISTINRVFFSLVGPSETGKLQFIYNSLKMEHLNQSLTKFSVLSTFPTSLRYYAKRKWKSQVCAGSNLWIYSFIEKERFKALVSIWRLLWRVLQFKSLCWHCKRWETSGSEHSQHSTQPFSPEQARKRHELMSFFRLHPGLKMSFEHNFVRKNLFLSACFCWDSTLSLRKMDQKFKFCRTIGYGDSYLEFLFRHFKVFRLQGILHDATRAVRAHSGKGPGYCYVIGRRRNSCLLGQVTGLLFCLYVKLFLPSIFNSVDFWSRMSFILLDMELNGKNIVNELELFIHGLYKDFHFFHQRLLNLSMRRHGTQVIYMELPGVLEDWIMKRCLLSFTI